ncbi:UNVERIFIED_CONTAM: hypothetical protein GTU68_010583 [Idotea baltica]|nr:hypothetical protein [Idotea baltica]
MQVTVYRSSEKEGMYVYMAEQTSLDTLPAPVMKQLGKPEKALEFDLKAQRSLPNADASEVLATIESQGFYVQMPADVDVETILARISEQSVPLKKD